MRKIAERPLSRALKIYQNLAIGFVIVACLILSGVIYLSISRVSIVIIPKPQLLKVSGNVKILPLPSQAGEISGAVYSATFSASERFPLSAEGGTAVEGNAHGEVSLINNTTQAQPLVQNTRVVAESGVIFRLEEYVTVPANGQLVAKVKADIVGIEGEIPPSKFIIPGLPKGLQDKIYAVSLTVMTGGVSYVRPLTGADLLHAKEVLSKKLLEQGITAGRSAIADTVTYDGLVSGITTTKEIWSAKEGETVGEISLELTEEINLVFYNVVDLANYAERELAAQVPAGFRVTVVNRGDLSTKFVEVKDGGSAAIVYVNLNGQAVLSEDAQVLSKDRFVGRAPHEVKTLLKASEAIESAELLFTPFWIKRVPTLEDHISIEIRDPNEAEVVLPE